jgi:hypothetical protein
MSDCVKTTYYRNKDGYGQATYKGKQVLHHRLTYCLTNNITLEDIKGLVVMHTCDTPACINPAHLKLGTQQENLLDMKNKDRLHKGSAHTNVKLTEDVIISIRLDPGTLEVIAKKHNVCIDTISRIKSKQSWKHVKYQGAQ